MHTGRLRTKGIQPNASMNRKPRVNSNIHVTCYREINVLITDKKWIMIWQKEF